MQVKADVDLIWENCLNYNSRDSDEPVREICNEVKKEFERLWAEAGLGSHPKHSTRMPIPVKNQMPDDTTQITEKEVPERYNLPTGSSPFKMQHTQPVALQAYTC